MAEVKIQFAMPVNSSRRAESTMLSSSWSKRFGDDPERIRQAEALLRTIRKVRNDYNVLFDSLIDNLTNNPDDIERTLEIVDGMEALDKFPNERVVAQIQEARIVAQLAYDRNLVNERMDEARTLLATGRYTDAIDAYLDLRTLQRDRFEARGYGDIFLNAVDEVVGDIPAVATALQERLPEFQRTGLTITAIAENDIATPNDDVSSAFFTEAAEIVTGLDRARELASEVAALISQVPLQFPDEPVDWYLSIQEILTLGRSDFRGEEGIVYAIEAAYRHALAPLVAARRDRALELFRTGNAAAATGNYGEALEMCRAALQSSRLWAQAEAVQAEIFELNPSLELITGRRGPDDGALLVSAQGHVTAATSLMAFYEIMNILSETGEDQEQTLPALRSQKDFTNGIVGSLQNGRTAWESDRLPFEQLPTGYINGAVAARFTSTTERWQWGLRRAVAHERELARRIAEVNIQEIPDTIVSLVDELTALEPLIGGMEIPVEDGSDATRTGRFPDDALAGYLSVAATATARIEVIRTTREELIEEPDYVLTSNDILSARGRLDRLEDDLETIHATAEEGIAASRSLIARSQELALVAEARVADMRTAIDALQVEAARNNFQALRDAYLDSLELRENIAFRREVDSLIRALGSELQALENAIVVRRVRELLTRANELYNQDEYVPAQDTLLDAQRTWEQTNVDPNTEIERLLRLVTAALSLEEGRELAFADPLYPILSNYLSIAQDDFDRARNLVNDGRKTQAEPLFDRAIENLRNVRDVRPLNWDARILELRIAQIRNADGFMSVFEARYEQAIGRLDSEGPLQVYSELEVLAEINPDYPGIRDQIRRLEIALNLRPDPLDQARRQRALEFFRRARSLSGGNRDQISVAVSFLEQAIELDPTNDDAAFLLDQLRIRLGGVATVALGTADEQQYRRAETLFSQGQVLQALSVVERLLQDADNQNYPPLVDLRRRIALSLGI